MDDLKKKSEIEDKVKPALEEFYEKRIVEIKDVIRDEIFGNTEIGEIFNNTFKFLSIPLSEGSISGSLFLMYKDYKDDVPSDSFDGFLQKLMNLYCEFISKYEAQIELYKYLEGEPNEIAKRLKRLIDNCDEVNCYLQQELNRYEVYHDMTVTNISETKTRTKQTKETHLSAPERLLVLEKIGFNELPFIKNLNDSEYKILMSAILNYDKRSIDGYINEKKETSSESKYSTTGKHKEEADKFLKQFSKD